MSVGLSLYAPEPGWPGVPVGSRTGVLVSGLLALLRAEPGLAPRPRWLRPPGSHGSGPAGDRLKAARASAGELGRLLGDRARYLLLVYPALPLAAHVAAPPAATLARTRRALQALHAKARLTGQRIVVVVLDLPVERAEGRALADGRAPKPDAAPYRELERTLFRAAHRLVLPAGFAEPLRRRYGLDAARLRTFRRHAYPVAEPAAAAGGPAAADRPYPGAFEWESGKVNFFYSGPVDAEVAPNFREILRAIRNAPDTRLHVCGPGRDAVREWLAELDVPNVRHHGRLAPPEHDWLAGRCHVGLILYPRDDPYHNLRPTLKYSAYVANGLAVLSTDLRRVAENIRADGVGQAMPIRELALELLRWAARPRLWSAARARAAELAPEVRSGSEMRGWIAELAAEG